MRSGSGSSTSRTMSSTLRRRSSGESLVCSRSTSSIWAPQVMTGFSAVSGSWKIMLGHILPNTIAPLVVMGTFIAAAAILIEAILSFLGVGLPPDIPTWGNVMAEGRSQFNEYPHNIFFPGIFLAVTVLAVNILGDGLRDTLDPKMAKRV